MGKVINKKVSKGRDRLTKPEKFDKAGKIVKKKQKVNSDSVGPSTFAPAGVKNLVKSQKSFTKKSGKAVSTNPDVTPKKSQKHGSTKSKAGVLKKVKVRAPKEAASPQLVQIKKKKKSGVKEELDTPHLVQIKKWKKSDVKEDVDAPQLVQIKKRKKSDDEEEVDAPRLVQIKKEKKFGIKEVEKLFKASGKTHSRAGGKLATKEEKDDVAISTGVKKIRTNTEKSQADNKVKHENGADGVENENKNSILDAAPVFDKMEFKKIVTHQKIKRAFFIMQKIIEGNNEKFANKMFPDFKYFLNVSSFKIPSCPIRKVKLCLPHSMLTEEDDVCFIVRDSKRGTRVDYETTREQVENMLAKEGITGIKTVMPFNQLKKEYGSFEMKGQLANSYDAFLCDGSIVGHVVGFLGRRFEKRTPIPVRMNTRNMAREFNTALRKTAYLQGQKGPLISIPVGVSKMSDDHLADNVENVIEQLERIFPGGYENIHTMHLWTNLRGSKAVPLYVSVCKPPEKTPYIIGPREENMKKMGIINERNVLKFQTPGGRKHRMKLNFL